MPSSGTLVASTIGSRYCNGIMMAAARRSATATIPTGSMLRCPWVTRRSAMATTPMANTPRCPWARTRWNTEFGNWEEFFTPDATLYKIILYEVNGSTKTAVWSGYVTPDSWLEYLGYRGTITVTARDNIGHLKDFPFVADGSITPDGYGLIAMGDIIEKALEVVEFPMDVVWGTAIPFGDGVYLITSARLNASLFDGMDWYEVLEQTLEAVGYVFRYVGRNKFTICSLRDMPEMGHYYETTGEQTMEFYGGSLELDPAVKQIREEADFKREAELKEDPKAGMLVRGNKREYTWQIRNRTGQAWDYQNVNVGGYGWLTGYGFLKGDDYSLTTTLRENEGDDAATAWPVLIANQQTPTTFQTYKLPLVSPNVVLHMVFGIPLEGDLTVWDLEERFAVDPADFLSLGKATPFAGKAVRSQLTLNVEFKLKKAKK